jgi:hypothetical protein
MFFCALRLDPIRDQQGTPRLMLFSARSQENSAKPLKLLAGVEGLEPPTPGFGDRCSSH